MKKNYLFLSFSLFLLGACIGHERAFVRSLNAPSFAEWILLNGRIITLNKHTSTEEAVAVRNGVIVAVGSDGEMRRWHGPNTREVNLGGRTVIPGLNDSYADVTRAALRGEPELRSLERVRQSLRSRFRELNRLGITSVGDLHTDKVNFAHRRLLNDMARTGELTLRINFYFAPEQSADQLAQFKRVIAETKQLRQTDMFRFAGFAGIFASGNRDREVVAPAIDKALSAAAKEGLRRALQFFAAGDHNFVVHAAEDHRARQLLDVIEVVNRETPLSPSRIGFTDVEDVSPETTQRIKKLGAGIIIQSGRYVLDESIEELRQEKKNQGARPLRTIIDTGIPLGVGSGASSASNHSPMAVLWWLVTGKSVAGAPMRDAKESLSRMEALRAYTLGSAWFTEDENRKGSIEVGKFADLAVLSDDYLKVPVDRIPALESLFTMVDGRIVYAAGPFAKFQKS